VIFHDATLGCAGGPRIISNDVAIFGNDDARFLAGPPLSLTGNFDFGYQGRIRLDPGAEVTINGPVIGGSGAVTSGDAITPNGGTLRLVGGNPEFRGHLNLANSTVHITDGVALGSPSHGTSLDAGATLQLSDDVAVAAEPLAVSGGSGAARTLRSVGGSNSWGGPIALSAPLDVAVDSGTLTLSGAITSASPVMLDKLGLGDLVISPNLRIEDLNVTVSAGTLHFPANNTLAGGSRFGMLILANGAQPTASLNLHNNNLILTDAEWALMRAQIFRARNFGAWDQPGVTSSAAASNPTGSTTLGLLTGSEFLGVHGPGATFNELPVAPADTLVKYTYYGDTDFNGVIDGDDYARLDNGYNVGLGGWLNGDADLNGFVDGDDYALTDNAFNTQSGTLRIAVDFISGDDRNYAKMNTPALKKVVEHFADFGTSYGAAFLSSVPEPSAAGVPILLVATLSQRRRARGRRARIRCAGERFDNASLHSGR
jgi:hypothetical protein